MEKPDVNDFTLGGIHPSEEGFQIGIASVEEERAKVGKSDLGHGLGMRQLSLNVVRWAGRAKPMEIVTVPYDRRFHVSLNRTSCESHPLSQSIDDDDTYYDLHRHRCSYHFLENPCPRLRLPRRNRGQGHGTTDCPDSVAQRKPDSIFASPGHLVCRGCVIWHTISLCLAAY